MKRIFACFLVFFCLCSTAFAEYDVSSLSDEELFELAYAVLAEIQNRTDDKGESQVVTETDTPMPTAVPNANVQSVYIKNYVGMKLSSCGYTSMGGDRRDYYGETNLLLVILCPDGTFIDPEDKAQLQNYTVIAQFPQPNTSFNIITNDEDDIINRGYDEIVLVVTNGDSSDIPELTEITPSPSKETQYMRDYVGRNLETVGYTAMNGNRYDKYGLDGLIEILIFDENGTMIDPEDHSEFIYYTVTKQNIEPNTEMNFTYGQDDDADNVIDQSISVIEITVQMTETGRATREALIAEEAALRESGVLVDLFKGTYAIGTDLPAGNYILSPLDVTEGSDVYIYQNNDEFVADEGEWEWIYGADDKSYHALHEGMYLEVRSGAIKALRSGFDLDGDEFELYGGIYYVGTDIEAGNYEMTQLSDSCDVYVYQNESAFQNEDCEWDFLYGEGDKERYTLREGMIIEISDGAAIVTKK